MDGITDPSRSLDEAGRISHREAGRKRLRAAVACTRCRRLRKKCSHQKAQAPCVGCLEAGVDHECRFPSRGEPDYARSYRRVKKPVEATSPKVAHSQNTSPSLTSEIRIPVESPRVSIRVTDRWDLLPPYTEVVEACKIFWTSFFQLGFLPKAIFLEQLANQRSSINVFFLLGILSVSARFTPSLIARYGDGLKAADVFMERAATLVIEEM